MKILILSRYQDSVNRGVETFAYELSKRLSQNHQVVILSGSDSDSLSKMVSGGYDVVMPLNGRMQALKASIGRLPGKYKLVIGGHSGIGRDDIWNIAVCKPDVFVALTEHQADWAKKWALGSKVVKIPNGIDLEKFSPKGAKFEMNLKNPIILSVGALVWYKHHERTINALSSLKKGSLLVVGSGQEKEKLEKLGKEKLGRRFKIVTVSYEDMPDVYRACDFFALPSWDRESFGIVYLEAMATNLPVIAPDDASRREIIGSAGAYTDVSDPKKYAQAIKEALEKKWDNIPRTQAEKFSWDKIAVQYEECLKNCLS